MTQESPTLDLTNDCFKFVTGFFEVISTSAPHIYHSALLLSPKNSIVQRLYGPQVNPLARVIQGVPTSWDASIATKRFSRYICAAAWSPCSRFVVTAQSPSNRIVVLDAATLKQLHTLYYPNQHIVWSGLVHSPDGHLLTGYSHINNCIISWDLQTGGLISYISDGKTVQCKLVAHSGCGTMLGGLFGNKTIITYNILSGAQISSHSVQEYIYTIWTHSESLQFATMGSGSITIWEVGFTSSSAPTQISSLPTPDNLSLSNSVFFPTLSQLALILKDRVLVWDAQHQKILLDSMDVKSPKEVAFSPNGHFFLCYNWGQDIHLWKKSPNGYLYDQKFTSSTEYPTAIFSPNGESIISFYSSILQLWHMTSSPTFSHKILTQAPKHTSGFFLEFSPDKSLVAIAQKLSNKVTVFDVKSGNPQVIINAYMIICGVGIIENRIIIVSHGEIATWELPASGCVLNSQWNTKNSIQTTWFDTPSYTDYLCASISPHLNYIALIQKPRKKYELCIMDLHTGWCFDSVEVQRWVPGFTPDGNRIWCASSDGKVEQLEIVKRPQNIKLESLNITEKPLSGFPWHSPCGYQITDDGWVLSPSGKQLIWLPHQWQSKIERRWGGKFLALFPSGLSEPLILELEV